MIGTIIEIVLIFIAIALILFELVVMWKNSEAVEKKQKRTDEEINDMKRQLSYLDCQVDLLIKRKDEK